MIYIIIIGHRWYITLSQHEASAFKRKWKGDKIIQKVVTGKQVIPGIIYIPELKELCETFNLKFI